MPLELTLRSQHDADPPVYAALAHNLQLVVLYDSQSVDQRTRETTTTLGNTHTPRAMSSAAPISADSSAASTVESASSSPPKPPRVVIVPGNGCRKIERANWYCNVGKQLSALGCDVRVQSMPDPDEAKESIWIPFIKDTLGADENTILIGHSSGAEAGMRFAERYPLRGLILVSACHTDLGCDSETISGYYPDAAGNHPWLWDRIKANAGWIVQFHSTDDPFIPPAEARHVAQNLASEYTEFTNRDHFMSRDMRELVDTVAKKCGLKQ